jgi:Mrp family chromosome partitioning ATPase
MSRDFELLQRLEKELSSPQFQESNATPIPGKHGHLTVVQESTATATLPSSNLAPVIRNEINKLVLRIFLSGAPVKVVMFAGVDPQADSPWISGCAADILAERKGGRVCLLDADMGSPSLHELYSVSNNGGLAAILADICPIGGAALRVTENLWVIPAGTNGANAQLLTPAKLQHLMIELLDQFDYVVISAPPCDKAAELGVIGSESESAVLVVDAATTRRSKAREAKTTLEAAHVRVLGVVFNNRRVPFPDLFYLGM